MTIKKLLAILLWVVMFPIIFVVSMPATSRGAKVKAPYVRLWDWTWKKGGELWNEELSQ